MKDVPHKRHGPDWYSESLVGQYISPNACPPLPPSATTELVTRGRLHGVLVDGCPDTGSCVNIVSYDFVRRQKWNFQPHSDLPHIQLPGRGTVRPLGTITLPWRFEGEERAYDIIFHVLAKCVHPVILGRKFLASSGSLGQFFSRMKRKIISITTGRKNRLFLLDSPRERGVGSWGKLNGHAACALADTGSDVMVISLDFAKSLNLDIETDSWRREWLELADGSITRTKGIVRGVEWTFGDENVKYRCDFVVLDNIEYEVILSNDFLFENRIFQTQDLFSSEQDDMIEAHQRTLLIMKR
ncbi:hypothetical protein ASPZODRAFT_2031408 [Penicilliopsis zonata CBS 506.65]|uniref:Peptidase A2 domain-containing protein n=1 Tax=Penicilliopsis zonata CBS 506.65 TaxID=1073090 RepID=A0A1L9SI53_9EURO|nr:hypothetical protein ASPZODRAFT_2031408 [Penicilliopsis zonata CBS 506.65]OJJ46801.1 hypothetical protein ASPZODRAFT_2031408 [Penicilliopsis zonata CBS 506.65]